MGKRDIGIALRTTTKKREKTVNEICKVWKTIVLNKLTNFGIHRMHCDVCNVSKTMTEWETQQL